MTKIVLLLKLLPDFLRLLNTAHKRVKQGVEIVTIKRAMGKIDDAFAKKNRAEGARLLNDIWND